MMRNLIKNILRESDFEGLGWMDDIPSQQKIYVNITDTTESNYLISVLQTSGYRFVSRSTEDRVDRIADYNTRFNQEHIIVGVIVNVYTKVIHRVLMDSDLGYGHAERYGDNLRSTTHTIEYINGLPNVDHMEFIDVYVDGNVN